MRPGDVYEDDHKKVIPGVYNQPMHASVLVLGANGFIGKRGRRGGGCDGPADTDTRNPPAIAPEFPLRATRRRSNRHPVGEHALRAE